MVPEETAITIEWLSKYILTAMDVYAATEELLEAVFSVQYQNKMMIDHSKRVSFQFN
jgi:hypothetical protein